MRDEAYRQNDVFASALTFASSEGILPAPGTAHAVHGASGQGHFPMSPTTNQQTLAVRD